MEGWSGEFDDYWCVDLVGTCSNEQAETFALQMLQFSKKYSSYIVIYIIIDLVLSKLGKPIIDYSPMNEHSFPLT